MEKHAYRLKEVCLEITDVCPLNCLHCSGMCGPSSKNLMPLNQAKKVIDEAVSIGCKLLEVSGGEPLAHPHLPEIVEHAKTGNLQTILYTSGTPMSVRLAERLKRSGLEKVVFNLQGAVSSTHDAITQTKGSFLNTISAIRTLKSMRFWVGAHFVPMKLNYEGLNDFVQLCHDLEVDEIGVLRFVSQGRGQTNERLLELSGQEFMELSVSLLDLTSEQKHTDIRVGRPVDFRNLFDPSIVKSECDAGISRCLITPSGEVLPCPAFKQNRQYIAGNVNNCSLGDIWNASPIWRMLRCFDYRHISEPCKSCEHLQQCRGGCIGQRILKYKDAYAAPDPRCFRCAIRAAEPNSSSTRFQG